RLVDFEAVVLEQRLQVGLAPDALPAEQQQDALAARVTAVLGWRSRLHKYAMRVHVYASAVRRQACSPNSRAWTRATRSSSRAPACPARRRASPASSRAALRSRFRRPRRAGRGGG